MTESRTMVIAATKRSIGGRGEYPVRYVVLKWKESASAHPYSRHMQVFDGEHDEYYIYGHYHMTLDDAVSDMIQAMKENNALYPLGNISHIPGMDFLDGSET